MELLVSYGDLTIFQNVAIRHLGFLKTEICSPICAHGSGGQYVSPYKISCRSVQLLLRYGDFSMATVRHLGSVLSILGPPAKSI